MSATYKAITATAQIKIGQGKLKGIFCSAAASVPTLTIYDSGTASTSDPKIIDTFTPVAGTMYPLPGDDGGIFFSKGLYAVIANTVTATFIYE